MGSRTCLTRTPAKPEVREASPIGLPNFFVVGSVDSRTVLPIRLGRLLAVASNLIKCEYPPASLHGTTVVR